MLVKYHILLILLFVLGIDGGRFLRKRDPMVRKMLHGQIKYKSDRALRRTISANPTSNRKSFDWFGITGGNGIISHQTRPDQYLEGLGNKSTSPLSGLVQTRKKSKRDIVESEEKKFHRLEKKCPQTSGRDFCEDPIDYPEKLIQSLNFTGIQKFVLLLNPANSNNDVENVTKARENDTSSSRNSRRKINRGRFAKPSLSRRIPGWSTEPEDEIETPVCDTLTKIIYPRIGRNRGNEFKFIYNPQRENSTLLETPVLHQSVRVEECLDEGKSCDSCGRRTKKTVCRQRYSFHRLIALDEGEGTTFIDTFSFPDGCICHRLLNKSGFTLEH